MIYLDHNATSPLLDEVRRVMEPWMGVPANPGSVHRLGQRAAAAVEEARARIADALGASPDGVVFTSGATEANNLALAGARAVHGSLVACSRAEHPSVWRVAATADWSELEVDRDGRTLLPDWASILSVQAVNHETGVVQASPAGRGGFVHVDATQAVGRVPVSLGELDALTLSGHKLGGPPGIGALLLRDGDAFGPLVRGGGQERGRRAGTVPTAWVVGLAEAVVLAVDEQSRRMARWSRQRTLLEAAVVEAGGELVGQRVERAANTICAVFPGILGESVVQSLDLREVCASSGAACASGSTRPSAVLTAMGHPEPRGGVRLSLGPRTEDAAVERAAHELLAVVSGLRMADDW